MLNEEVEMVYCPRCGERNREGSRFCRNCGTLLEEKPLKSRFISGEFRETPVREDLRAKPRETSRDVFEWDTVIMGAVILMILTVILGRLMGLLGVLSAVLIILIYVLSAARRKSAAPLIIIMALLTAAAASALLGI
ncbi:zinc ribbon domain-containing protein [Methanothermobacter thermautotrophicus]|nr:zinc ribbon domain-containing protein [Methanothermobacter thermautotrophicus]